MNYLIVTGAIVERDGKILLVQEKKPQAYKLWNVPAGHLDKGESLADGARREVREETGYDVKLDGLLGIYCFNGPHANPSALIILFRAKVVGGELKFPEDELLDARWFEPSEALSMKDSQLRGIRKGIEDFVSGKKYPLDIFREG